MLSTVPNCRAAARFAATLSRPAAAMAFVVVVGVAASAEAHRSAAGSTAATSPTAEVQLEVRNRVERIARGDDLAVYLPTDGGVVAIPVRKRQALKEFYLARDGWPVWEMADGRLRLEALLQAIEGAAAHGLDPADYHMSALRAWHHAEREEDSAALKADRDLLASDAFLLLASHLSSGRVVPQDFDPEWTIHTPGQDPLPLLQQADISGDVAAILASAAPAHPGYRDLKASLAELRAHAQAGPWPLVPTGLTLRPGMMDYRVPILRERLVASGDMAPSGRSEAPDAGLPALAEAYDGKLVEAVLQFQKRHGLEPDGIVGRHTYAALNIPADERIRQVELNLERWRWLPADLGRRHVLVNVAGYDYRLVEDGEERLYGRTIVGRAYRSTPVFSDAIRYLVFNPTWTVPRRLAVEDKLPQIREDPDFLRREGFRVYAGWSRDAEEVFPEFIDWHSLSKNNFPYRLVQDPGGANALGRVKFLFPNKYDIYLHDTPSRSLFNRADRAYSSGCIRVEHPLTLAEYLLEGEPGWGRTRIERTLEGAAERWVTLREPVPVHLLHWTAWRDPDGRLQFRGDLYGRDARLAAALDAAAPNHYEVHASQSPRLRGDAQSLADAAN